MQQLCRGMSRFVVVCRTSQNDARVRETVFHHAHLRRHDKDDPNLFTAEGRARGRLFRIVYGVDDDTIIPLSIIPITGFPIARRELRGNRP
jgi:hypothetical protein